MYLPLKKAGGRVHVVEEKRDEERVSYTRLHVTILSGQLT